MSPKVPQYQQPADDPQTLNLKQQAEQDQIAASQERVQIDSASLLARYGSRITLANAGGAAGATAAGASPTMSSPGSGLANILTQLRGAA